VLLGVLNDEFVAGPLGLVTDHLPPSHSLQCVHTWPAVAVLSVSAIVENCSRNDGICNDCFITPHLVGGRGIVFGRFVSLLATLRENGWTDLHEIFREGVE